MDEDALQKVARGLRRVIADLQSVESRLRKGDAGNLTYRKVVSALMSARGAAAELDSTTGDDDEPVDEHGAR